jgi:hypothetical protein
MTSKMKRAKNVVWTSLSVETLQKFDEQCEKEKRSRPQLLRIIVDEYYLKINKGDKK